MQDDPTVLDGLPLPGPHLRKRVHGAYDLTSFLAVGQEVAGDLAIQYERWSGPAEHPHTVLDWGCGCGRVLRHLVRLLPEGTRFIGADIDREAIGWCQEHLGSVARFVVNNASPPIALVDAAEVDLLYGVSVLSHLPEPMQDAWLAEIARLLKPGGLALLSVHGPSLLPPDLDARWLAGFETRGFGFHAGGGTMGLPDFYQQAFHRQDYIERHWSQWLEPLAVLPRGMAGYQDLVVCRRAP